MSTSVAVVFLLLATAVTAFSLEERETLHIAQTKISQARDSFQAMLELRENKQDLDYMGMAFSSCAKLYGESESKVEQLLANENHKHDDAQTWLSGVLANHRTCLDGLVEKGLDVHADAQNLTSLISEALAFYGKTNDIRRGVEFRQCQYQNDGIRLESWTPATSNADFIVAQDGSGTQRTIKDAVAELGRRGKRALTSGRIIIHVKAGVYNEQVEIGEHLRNVMLVGDGMDKTIVTGSKNYVDGYPTHNTATFGVSGDGFWARDITFENTAGPQKHQAVALKVSSDLSVFYRCGFRGYQDTLYVHSLRQFYRDCHIYGTIDFIFGDASAVFQNCDIFVRKPMSSQSNMITAQGRDNPNENTGISIQGSRIRAAPEFFAVKNSYRSYLGRPWKKYSRTVVMETDLDGLISPKGWTEWRGSYALSTLFYAEYMNTGFGASTDSRVNWPGFHVINSPEQASPFTAGRFIQGDSWIPATGVPFKLGV
ncbi:hypothetical protein K2173_013405 [Erythroxylum novogranatense]|uniref:Pectinesterase n=1 Tax=Erythroxylum novogranatense TaxID=1862640 RepID=A0AAV8SA13_9ROSI|nr:hypothetical protein K2173_013405 [Erythroxylum novogranatense]